MFEQADANGDGQISADEFAASSPAKFERLDKDGDGMVTLDEVKDHRHDKHDDDDA